MIETDLWQPGHAVPLPNRGKEVVDAGVDSGTDENLKGAVFVREFGIVRILIFSGGAHWEWLD